MEVNWGIVVLGIVAFCLGIYHIRKAIKETKAKREAKKKDKYGT